MLTHEPFYETLKKRNLTVEEFLIKYNVDRKMFKQLETGRATTKTYDYFCSILHCQPEDIVQYVKDENE